jgi:hypothetical protein
MIVGRPARELATSIEARIRDGEARLRRALAASDVAEGALRHEPRWQMP